MPFSISIPTREDSTLSRWQLPLPPNSQFPDSGAHPWQHFHSREEDETKTQEGIRWLWATNPLFHGRLNGASRNRRSALISTAPERSSEAVLRLVLSSGRLWAGPYS